MIARYTSCALVAIDGAAHGDGVASAKVPRRLNWLACLVMVGNLSSEILSALGPLNDGRDRLVSLDVIQAEDTLKLRILNDAVELVNELGWRLLSPPHREFVWLPSGKPTLGVVSWSILRHLGLRDIACGQHDFTLGKVAVGVNEAKAECVLILGQKRRQGMQHDMAIDKLLVGLAEGG